MNNPPNSSDPTSSRGPSPRQLILGAFVTWQLIFLVLSNLLGLYHDSQNRLDGKLLAVIDRVLPGYSAQGGQAWKTTDELSTPMRRWAQLTGQEQNWSLFAPGVYKVTGFPALVLIWDDEPTSAPALARSVALIGSSHALDAAATVGLLQLRPDELQPPGLRLAAPALAGLAATHPLERAAIAVTAGDPAMAAPAPNAELFLSDNEPANAQHFFRAGLFRIRRYESGLILYLTQADDEIDVDASDRWAREIRRHVSEYADQLQAYVKWRLAAYQQRHPERPPPRQVILERVFKILPPNDKSGAVWSGPTTLPLVRWQPAVAWESEYRPLEQYNPVAERFESLRK